MVAFCAAGAQHIESRDGAWRTLEPAQQDRSQWKVVGVAEARLSTLRTFGAATHDPAESATQLVSVVQDRTPFVATLLLTRPLWHSQIDGLKLQLPSSPPGFEDSFQRTFDLFLDPVCGQLVKVRSRWPQGEAPIPDELEADQAAEQMNRSGDEKYHGFPGDPPAVTFISALDSVQRGGGNPLVAKQIIGDYVIWSRIGKWEVPRAVWAVTLRGVPPLHARGDDKGANSAARYIVDARSGEYLCASNTPHPDSVTSPNKKP
jgi:hypothetical protein